MLLTVWLAQQLWVMLSLLSSEVQHERFISQKAASGEVFIVKRQGNVRIRYLSKYYFLQIFTFESIYYYPQRSCGKVMFLHLSVILLTGWGVSVKRPRVHTPLGHKHPLGTHPLGTHIPTPLSRHPHGQKLPLDRNPAPWAYTSCPVHLGYTPSLCMLAYSPLPSACWDTVNKWAVRILLECILVTDIFFIKCSKVNIRKYNFKFAEQM